MLLIMVAELISFIVIGKIPGTDVVLDYQASLLLVGITIIFIVANLSLLASQRRRIKRLLKSTYEQSLNLITI